MVHAGFASTPKNLCKSKATPEVDCQGNPLISLAGTIFALICAISFPAGIGAIRGIAGGFDHLGMGASEMCFVRLSAAALVAMARPPVRFVRDQGTGRFAIG